MNARASGTMRRTAVVLGFFIIASSISISSQQEDSGPRRALSKARTLDLRGVEWGLGTSAYQVEGAANEGGRQPSVWDIWAKVPGHVFDNTTGDVAADEYHRYKSDVKLFKKLKVKYYRFSISWSRLITDAGGPDRRVNPEGVKYYNNLIKRLRDNGIEPMVTLYHWDLPQTAWIDKEFWLSTDTDKVVEEFVFYANAAFKTFGDRVKYWSTFNEPWSFILLGYGWAVHAPGLTETKLGIWQAGYNVLVTHGHVVKLFRNKYARKGSKIGMNLNCDWGEPLNKTSPGDKKAAEWSMEFRLSWFADPLYKGDYPASMKRLLGSRLPPLSKADKKLIKGSTDYFALNHYTSNWISGRTPEQLNSTTEVQFWDVTQVKDGVLIGAAAESAWLKVVPWGFRKLLVWIKNRYGNPQIWITEQGVSAPGESSMSEAEAVNDVFRVNYYQQYLKEMKVAMKESGVRVKKYIAWSALDNFEWDRGFHERFGVIRVDLNGDLSRKIKKSAFWLRDAFYYGNATLSS